MPKINVTLAQNIADEFLANEVGNLLMTGHPQLVNKSRSYWMMPVLLGNVRQGILGEVGKVLVYSNSGEVILIPKDKEKIKRNAKKLSKSIASMGSTYHCHCKVDAPHGKPSGFLIRRSEPVQTQS